MTAASEQEVPRPKLVSKAKAELQIWGMTGECCVLRFFVESETVILPFMVLDQKATYYLRFELVCSFDYLFPVDICKSALKRNLLHVKQD